MIGMKLGSRVIIRPSWSSFRSQHGTVRSLTPLLVELDDDPRWLSFDADALILLR